MKELNADLRRAVTRGESVPREYKLQEGWEGPLLREGYTAASGKFVALQLLGFSRVPSPRPP